MPLQRPRLVVAAPAVRLLALVAFGLSSPGMAAADPTEQGGEPRLQRPAQGRDPDFLFGRPRWSVGIRAGWILASEDSELFDFARDLLTIDKGDFDAPVVAVEVGYSLTPRLDIVSDFGFTRATVASEYREFVDLDDLPITQESRLTTARLGASVKSYVTPRGREVVGTRGSRAS